MRKITRGQFLKLGVGAGAGVAGLGRGVASPQGTSTTAAADLVVHNGRVYTVDDDMPRASYQQTLDS